MSHGRLVLLESLYSAPASSAGTKRLPKVRHRHRSGRASGRNVSKPRRGQPGADGHAAAGSDVDRGSGDDAGPGPLDSEGPGYGSDEPSPRATHDPWASPGGDTNGSGSLDPSLPLLPAIHLRSPVHGGGGFGSPGPTSAGMYLSSFGGASSLSPSALLSPFPGDGTGSHPQPPGALRDSIMASGSVGPATSPVLLAGAGSGAGSGLGVSGGGPGLLSSAGGGAGPTHGGSGSRAGATATTIAVSPGPSLPVPSTAGSKSLGSRVPTALTGSRRTLAPLPGAGTLVRSRRDPPMRKTGVSELRPPVAYTSGPILLLHDNTSLYRLKRRAYDMATQINATMFAMARFIQKWYRGERVRKRLRHLHFCSSQLSRLYRCVRAASRRCGCCTVP